MNWLINGESLRCHRIGQTRDVHIYRLISQMTVEENILKKANQKRTLNDMAIEGGQFNTAFFKSNTLQDLFKAPSGLEVSVIINYYCRWSLIKKLLLVRNLVSHDSVINWSSIYNCPVFGYISFLFFYTFLKRSVFPYLEYICAILWTLNKYNWRGTRK